MDKQDIKNKILNNKFNWDENTTNILIDYFYELFLTIGNFMEVNNLLEKFIEGDNLKNGIVYVQDKLIGNKYDAVYNYKDLLIKVANINKDSRYIKYILFHEMTHAVSKNNNGVGFYSCQGMNEGTTELITILRNNKVGYRVPNIGIYSIVTSLCYLLGDILGYSNMFHSYFYDGNKIEKLIEEKGMNYNEILTCFDYFHRGNNHRLNLLQHFLHL